MTDERDEPVADDLDEDDLDDLDDDDLDEDDDDDLEEDDDDDLEEDDDDDLDEDDDEDLDEDDDEDLDEDDDDEPVSGATATGVLEYIVRSLVDDPDAVAIDVQDRRQGVAMQVQVAPDDMGRVIGRRGRIANSIRTVVRAAAVKDGVDVDVDFVD